MVVPGEIVHAGYAMPVLKYLLQSFRSVTRITSRERLFPRLNQDTMLVLADGRSGMLDARAKPMLVWVDVDDATTLRTSPRFSRRGQMIDVDDLVARRSRFVEHYLTPQARDLYRALAAAEGITRLGRMAQVGIGYVTGNNRFFHLNHYLLSEYGIPVSVTRKAVTRSSSLEGLVYTKEDWEASWNQGEAVRLLHITNGPPGGCPGVKSYLSLGEATGVPTSFKCRSRNPWYEVPHVNVPDAILTYMSGGAPRLVANKCGAVVPNTLHAVRLRSEVSSATALAASFLSSLTQLSAEIEGHGMGGGLLKLEPREADQLLIARVLPSDELIAELDYLLRSGWTARAHALADKAVLKDGLGLTDRECGLLTEGVQTLRNRRFRRGAQDGSSRCRARSRPDPIDERLAAGQEALLGDTPRP